MAGSAVRYLAQQPMTVAILKDTNMTVEKEVYRFGVLFDGSPCSEKVLRKTISMMKDRDRLTTITVLEQGMDETGAIASQIAMITLDRPVEVIFLENEPGMTIKDRIKKYLQEQSENDEYVDFCAVGNRGLNVGSVARGDNYLGHVAEAMIAFKRLNVIFVP